MRLEIIKKAIGVVVIIISLQFGIYGLLWGSALLSVSAFFINSYYTGKFIAYPSWEQIFDVLPIILLATLVGAEVYYVDKIFLTDQAGDFLRLVCGTVLGVSTYLVLIKLLYDQPLTEFIKIFKRE